jgi:DNA-binding CsgD family transcriptional regulator
MTLRIVQKMEAAGPKGWRRAQAAVLARRDDVPGPAQPLEVTRQGLRFTLRLLEGTSMDLLLVEGEEPHRAPSPDRWQLTRREGEVLAWLTQGKSNPEIATILGTSPRTVEKHLERIYEKLGVESRAGAVARALEG